MDRILFTRCPVPTSTAIADQKGFFDQELQPLHFETASVSTLGPEYANAHFTHSIGNLIREGGCTPPLWARSNGAATSLLALTFMREDMSIYVRADSPATSVTDLAGCRIALPVWRDLVFDFWRVAAHRGIFSALDVHEMTMNDVICVDVAETNNPHRRLNRAGNDASSDAHLSEYSGQLKALQCNKVDAIFAKGAESIVLLREAQGSIRKLYDLNTSSRSEDLVNNATPRLITCSLELLERNRDAVVAYCRALLRASRWATDHPDDLSAIVCAECDVLPHEVGEYFPPNYAESMTPSIDATILSYLQLMSTFMVNHGFVESDPDLERWCDFSPMHDALADY
jgi:ABC-type nitrate/sulfonate/bicarbonate transport system substrate-binding protein